MHLNMVDKVLERSDDRIVTLRQVRPEEDYLRDHFPEFPVLPGVLMVEAMVQSARLLVEGRAGARRLVLGGVRGIKYGTFVRPGDTLRVEVTVRKALPDGGFDLEAQALVHGRARDQGGEPPVAAAGRFSLRPVRK